MNRARKLYNLSCNIIYIYFNTICP